MINALVFTKHCGSRRRAHAMADHSRTFATSALKIPSVTVFAQVVVKHLPTKAQGALDVELFLLICSHNAIAVEKKENRPHLKVSTCGPTTTDSGHLARHLRNSRFTALANCQIRILVKVTNSTSEGDISHIWQLGRVIKLHTRPRFSSIFCVNVSF